jgi:hypothetical protein
MFRKIRRPTPDFKIPTPFNAMRGGFDDLQTNGVFPYCTMMQVACEDKYGDYVVCRGFDTRMLRFVDYAEGSSEKPGISVAKPYGCRVSTGGAKRYRIGEVFTAFLPTQGMSDIDPHFVPPSPVEVNWRLGQNPGTVGGAVYGGHPTCLTDEISIMYDHNGQVVNWMLVHTETKLFRFQSQETLTGSFCSACVRHMSGGWPHIANIYDPEGVFSGMESGTKGYVLFQEGRYYILNAKCDPDLLEDCECDLELDADCEC